MDYVADSKGVVIMSQDILIQFSEKLKHKEHLLQLYQNPPQVLKEHNFDLNGLLKKVELVIF